MRYPAVTWGTSALQGAHSLPWGTPIPPVLGWVLAATILTLLRTVPPALEQREDRWGGGLQGLPGGAEQTDQALHGWEDLGIGRGIGDCSPRVQLEKRPLWTRPGVGRSLALGQGQGRGGQQGCYGRVGGPGPGEGVWPQFLAESGASVCGHLRARRLH